MKSSKSQLKLANSLLRKRKYEEAKEAYKEALINTDDAIKEIIIFNLNYAEKKINTNKKEITRPDWLDEKTFKKIIKLKLFDEKYYKKNYPKETQKASNLLEHFLKIGIKSGLNPSEKFDTNYYISENPDVANSGINPFIHYVLNGRNEGRLPKLKPYITKYKASAVKYVPKINITSPKTPQLVKPICFYLPQYHPIPENDKWWGKGFTEWTNVKPAKPQYEGHYQPHIPHEDIGYYNLLDRETQAKQIELAKQYGIGGFCYYLYWFSGKRLLEQPLDNMLADPTLDFPFCVCWANENWSRRWDGLDNDLLMVQNYSAEDDIAFIKNISKYLKDKRYIKINNKPLIVIYRPNLFPDMNATVKRWREWCLQNDVGEIYLAYPQSFESVDPAVYNFDAALEFPPNNSNPPNITKEITPVTNDFQSKVYDWRVLLDRSDNYKDPEYTLFRSANPSWDNTARKKNKGIIFENTCPKLFTKHLTNAFSETIAKRKNKDERLVFINAWNEWAEGAHLEPDQRYGYAWLQAVRDSQNLIKEACNTKLAIVIHAFYVDVLEEVLKEIDWIHDIDSTVYITTTHEKLKETRETTCKFNYKFVIRSFENKGRDVLPFLKIMDDVVADKNEMLIKVHTKKSLHRIDGDTWRKELYSQLLSFPKYVRGFSKFKENKELSLISPDGNLVPISYYWGSNEKNVLNLCKKYSINFSHNKNYQFIAGTMFLAKVSLFKELIEQRPIIENDFDNELGQIDGTLAHAYERFFGIYACEKNKKLDDFGLLEKNFSYAERA